MYQNPKRHVRDGQTETRQHFQHYSKIERLRYVRIDHEEAVQEGPSQARAMFFTQEFCHADLHTPGTLSGNADPDHASSILAYLFSNRENGKSAEKITTTRLTIVTEIAAKQHRFGLVETWEHDLTSSVLVRLQPCSRQIPKVDDMLHGVAPGSFGLAYSGRQLDESRIDHRLLEFWLNHCESNHGKQCRCRPWMAHFALGKRPSPNRRGRYVHRFCKRSMSLCS